MRFLHFADQVLHGVRRDTPKVSTSASASMWPSLATRLDQVQHPVDFGAGKSIGKNTTSRPLRARTRGLDRQIDGLFQRPLVGVLEMCLLDGTSITMPSTPQSTARLTSSFMQRERRRSVGPRLRLTISLMASLSWRHDRHAGFDAVDAGLGQPFGDANLIVLAEDHAGLLLAVAQRDVVDLDLFGELKILRHLRRVIPFTNEPVVGFPGGWVGHGIENRG